MAGYRNLIQASFLHRDISIGNVLLHEEGKEVKSVFANLALNGFDADSRPEDSSAKLAALLKQAGIDNQCHGFLIDGDMCINLNEYFSTNREGSRSVRHFIFLNSCVPY